MSIDVRKGVMKMIGKDCERCLNVVHRIINETRKQIHILGRRSDHRLEQIDHTHSVHVRAADGSPEGVPDGGHGCGSPHTHALDTYLTGRNDPAATNYRRADPGHTGPDHFDHVTDQLTYPIMEARGYPDDKHFSHQHIEQERLYEREHPEPAAEFSDPIWELGEEFRVDVNKFRHIQANMYTEIETFHNNYGSPWTEAYDLEFQIDQMKAYVDEYPELQWIGEKYTLLNLFQMILSTAIDAKWAVIYHQDWMQRAYDHEYNEGDPSVYWDHFEEEKTIGQVHQENESMEGRVNVRPPSLDSLSVPSLPKLPPMPTPPF